MALIAWAALGAVVWNVVFDGIVTQAGRDYLTLQALHQDGKGPAVTIRGVMSPGVTRAVRAANASAGAVIGVGVLAAWLAGRRRPAPSTGRTQ